MTRRCHHQAAELMPKHSLGVTKVQNAGFPSDGICFHPSWLVQAEMRKVFACRAAMHIPQISALGTAGAGTERLAESAVRPCSCGAGLLLCAWVQPSSAHRCPIVTALLFRYPSHPGSSQSLSRQSPGSILYCEHPTNPHSGPWVLFKLVPSWAGQR